MDRLKIAYCKDLSVIDIDITKGKEGFVLFFNNQTAKIASTNEIKNMLINVKNLQQYQEMIKRNKHYYYNPEILKLELETKELYEQVLRIDEDGEIHFNSYDFLKKLLYVQDTKYISLSDFALNNNCSKTTIKNKIKEGKIDGVIAIYSKKGNVSAYVIPEDSKIN